MQQQVQPQPLQENSRVKKKKSKKVLIILLWLISILLFAGLGAGIYALLTKEDEETTGAKELSCSYNDETYEHGTTFQADDGCNQCVCNNDKVTCTTVDCEDTNGSNEDTTTTDETESDTSGSNGSTNDTGTTTDPYEGWKTYANEEWGISFKHNGSGEETLSVDNPDNDDPNVYRIGYRINSKYNEEIVIQWRMWENEEQLPLNQFYDAYQSYLNSSCDIDKNFSVGNKTGIKAFCEEANTGGIPRTEVFIMDSQKRIFNITYLHYMDEELLEVTDLSIQTISVN